MEVAAKIREEDIIEMKNKLIYLDRL